MSLSELEYSLIQLTWVTNRLNAVAKKFPEIKGTDSITGQFKGTIREYIVLQLHGFIKIRKKLIKNPKIKIIDDCLEPLWQPILELKTPIKKLRNKYIAHIQDNERTPFEISIHDIIDQYQLSTKFGFWIYLSHCVVGYELLLETNIKKEYEKAQKKYQSRLPAMLAYGTINITNYKPHLLEKLQKANNNLKTNNFIAYKDIKVS